MESRIFLDSCFSKLEFNLPIGLLDDDKNLHQQGIMRATNGLDEFFFQQDLRSQANPDYGIFILFSRTIIQLGNLEAIAAEMLESLFLSDLKYLVELYNSLNPPQASISVGGKI